MSISWARIQNHIVAISATVAALGTILGGGLIIDSRYAHAQSVMQELGQQTQLIQNIRLENQLQAERLQLLSVEDRIFYLEQKEVRTPQDQAQLNRFHRAREDAVKRLDALGRYGTAPGLGVGVAAPRLPGTE